MLCRERDCVTRVNEQEVRGGRLDHEHHAMRETRETITAAMDQAIPRLVGDIAAGRAKNKHVPCCRGRVGPVIPINAWLGTDRVTRVN